MTPDLFWIPGPWSGRLAIATRPRGGDWLGDEAAGWRGAGLDWIVSLLEEEESASLGLGEERSAAESQGLRFVSLPIPDLGVPASLSEAVTSMRGLVDALESGRTVAVHCRQGIGRSGLVTAGLLMLAGTELHEAIGTVTAARGHEVPETPSQLRWLERLSGMVPARSES